MSGTVVGAFESTRVWFEVQRTGRLGTDAHGTMLAAYDAAQKTSSAFPDDRVLVVRQPLTAQGLPAKRGRRVVAKFLAGEEQA